MDVDARIQVFDLKTKYTFSTVAGRAYYNAPLYKVAPYPSPDQPGGQSVSYYPVYQGFMEPCYINGIQVPFFTQRDPFQQAFPFYLQPLPEAGTGDGSVGPYSLSLPFFPAIPGHIDTTGIIAVGALEDPIVGASLDTSVPLTSLNPGVFISGQDTNNKTWTVTDSGQFSSSNENVGFLQATNGTTVVSAGTVNYATGDVSVTFPAGIASGNSIQASCYFYQQGIPRGILFFNNVIKVLPPPNVPYVVEMDAYLSPAAFLSTADAIPFAYMSEYIARGAARKILSDTGDIEQFAFYEPFFQEQELLVKKRSDRQFTSTKSYTIYSAPNNSIGFNNIGYT